MRGLGSLVWKMSRPSVLGCRFRLQESMLHVGIKDKADEMFSKHPYFHKPHATNPNEAQPKATERTSGAPAFTHGPLTQGHRGGGDSGRPPGISPPDSSSWRGGSRVTAALQLAPGSPVSEQGPDSPKTRHQPRLVFQDLMWFSVTPVGRRTGMCKENLRASFFCALGRRHPQPVAISASPTDERSVISSFPFWHLSIHLPAGFENPKP